jgi:hypothetical protein
MRGSLERGSIFEMSNLIGDIESSVSLFLSIASGGYGCLDIAQVPSVQARSDHAFNRSIELAWLSPEGHHRFKMFRSTVYRNMKFG